jgi:hypothetical protein
LWVTRIISGCSVELQQERCRETTMLKVALLGATVLVAATTAMAANHDPGAAAAPVAVPSCALVSPLDPGCAMRIADSNGDAVELASLAAPAPVIDWTPLHPPHSTGLDFKDAATDPGSVLPATLERDAPHPLIPALFALGAMVVLLRKRPV